MTEFLDSNRVNYLIWRYLIEGNYRETAVKFQKEWHIDAPHRQFDFAPHVRSHALVDVLNKGLRFGALERSFAQSQQRTQSASQDEPTAFSELVGVFGPPPSPQQQEKQQQQQAQRAEQAARERGQEPLTTVAPPPSDLEMSRKRQMDRPAQSAIHHGSPAKRPRLSNGYENGDGATTPMEVDGQNGDSHAYPSPKEVEQAPTLITHTNGPEQGTQIDKVEELSTETTFVSLGSSGDPAASSPLTAMSRINGEGAAPVLLHCQWNPRDPTILAGAGTDALARIWTVSRGAPADSAVGHVNGADIAPEFHSLIDEDVPSKATVTAMAWNGDGSAIAVATDSDDKGRLTLWSSDGANLLHFEVPEAPIFAIRWSPNNAAILGIAPDQQSTLVTVFHAKTSNTLSHLVTGNESEPLDAAWTSDSEFLLCGGDLFRSYKCTGDEITEVHKFTSRPGDKFTQVQFDSISRTAATCGEKGFIDIWDFNGTQRTIEAHSSAVTVLAWQPIQSLPASGERLLASGGEDGVICIWNTASPDNKSKFSMAMGPPIVALSFTPDGAFLAGATNEKILIWKVGDSTIPRASWNRTHHPGWISPRNNPESDEEDEHCLGWDSEGHKLAYGVNNRLAVINFR